MTPKLLSPERLREAFLVLEEGISEDDRQEVGQEILAHIAALEADNAALAEEFEDRRKTLLGAVAEEKTLWTEKSARGALNGMRSRIQCLPGLSSGRGAHLFAEHAKALVRARNEGLEEAAVYLDANREGGAPCAMGLARCATAIRARKKAES